jgi:hypothetical protein
MEWERIRKRPEDYADVNLRNYRECARTFSWEQARAPHLRQNLQGYADYYNKIWAHRSLDNDGSNFRAVQRRQPPEQCWSSKVKPARST